MSDNCSVSRYIHQIIHTWNMDVIIEKHAAILKDQDITLIRNYNSNTLTLSMHPTDFDPKPTPIRVELPNLDSHNISEFNLSALAEYSCKEYATATHLKRMAILCNAAAKLCDDIRSYIVSLSNLDTLVEEYRQVVKKDEYRKKRKLNK